jgi:hypothetical protein
MPTSTYRSPAGPPPGPTSPWPESRTRMPSATPGGTLAVMVRRARTRPSPPHWRHGSGMTSPTPRQTGHGRAVTTWPRKDRCTDWISPRPAQVSQTWAALPSAAPAPRHASHRTAVSTVSSRVTPVLHSSRVSSMRIRASEPGCTRLRGPRPPPMPPPKNASMMSPSPNPANGSRPPPPPPLPSGSPPMSTILRFCGSESTS